MRRPLISAFVTLTLAAVAWILFAMSGSHGIHVSEAQLFSAAAQGDVVSATLDSPSGSVDWVTRSGEHLTTVLANPDAVALQAVLRDVPLQYSAITLMDLNVQ
jgi:hypothetical protein